LLGNLQSWADSNSNVTLVAAEPPRSPECSADAVAKGFWQLGIPVLYPETGAEYVNSFDTLRLLNALWHYFATNH